MGIPPFLIPVEVEQAPEATAQIVEFPRAITLAANLRQAQRQVERLDQQLADNDIRSSDRDEQLRALAAQVGLPYWQQELREAENAIAMLGADDTLTFRGQMYRADLSANGAN
jgi:hypothetical protein